MNATTTRTAAETDLINKTISARILYAMANGDDARTAMDKVLGAGTYDKLVSDLYDGLRAKAGK
jgi:hypothetical protein